MAPTGSLVEDECGWDKGVAELFTDDNPAVMFRVCGDDSARDVEIKPVKCN